MMSEPKSLRQDGEVKVKKRELKSHQGILKGTTDVNSERQDGNFVQEEKRLINPT